MYVMLQMKLIDDGDINNAKDFGDFVVLRMKIQTSRMMDHLAAKSIYFLSVAYERKGLIASPQFRVVLFDILRECVLHHNSIGQATIMNIIIRSFLSQNLFEQARSFISKTTFPEAVSNN